MRGKIVIVLIGLVALAAAGFAWWVNYHRAEKCRVFWGTAGASAVRFAEKTEMLSLVSEPCEGEPLVLAGGERRWIAKTIDVSRRPGLMNARYSLMQDAGYVWPPKSESEESAPAPTSARHALRFHGPHSVATAVIDWESGRVDYVEGRVTAQLNAKAAEGWKSYFSRIDAENQADDTKKK